MCLYSQNGMMFHRTRDAEFKQLFHDYYEKLHYYAYTLLKQEEEAGDVVQTAFVHLWEKMDGLEHGENIPGYLYRSVHNLSLNVLRQRRSISRAQRDPAYAGPGSASDDAGDKLSGAEWAGRIKAAIDALPEQCRLIFRKSRYEDKKYAEIAGELGISVKTVEVQMSKALKILRSKLTP